MLTDQATLKVVDVLSKLGVPWMLVGSMSSNYYGVERSTHDADFVVAVEELPLNAIAKELGDGFRLDPQMRFETITCTTMHRIHLRDIDFKIEIFHITDDAHDQARFARRRAIKDGERVLWLPTPEDVVVTKLRWSKLGARRKDIDDVANVIAVQGERLDWPYILAWCDQHGTRQLAERIRAAVPKI